MKKNYYLLLVMTFVLSLSSQVFGQASAYQFTPSLGTYTAITGTALTTTNLCQTNVALGFTFDFEGTGYTTVDISEDGYISFGSNTFCTNFNDLDNTPANNRPLLAPLWDNLNLDAPGAITGLPTTQFEHTTTGAAGSQIWTGQWTDVHWAQLSSAGVISFQVKLYEATDCIEFIYEQGTGSVLNGSASIGLSGLSTFLSVQNTTLTPTISSTVETSTISTKPANGQVYQFCPPSCPAPSALVQTSATSTSIDMSWTTGGATDWEIEYGATGFVLGTGTSQLVSTTASTTVSGLTASTCYDVYVRDICAPGDSSIWIGPTEMCTAFPAPFVEDFDANATRIMGALANGWSSVSTNTTNPNFPYNWFTANNNVAFASGPDVDHTSGSGNYMYTNAFNTGFGDTAMLFSSYIDFGGLTNPALRYWYHKFGNNMPDLIVQIDSGMGWQGVDTIVGETHLAHATSPTDWSEGIKELGGYTGIARLRFIAVSLGCCNGMMAVDDIEIFDLLPFDAKMTSIIQPVDGGCEGDVTVEVEFQNNGGDSITSGLMSVSYQIGTSAPVTETVNQIIPPFAKATHLFAATGTAAAGTIDITVWTNLTGDGFLNNDSITDSVIVSQISDEMLYCEGFENGNGGWTFSGTNSSWAIGAPSGTFISTAANGVNAAVTNLTGIPNTNEVSFLVSPCFDFSQYENDPILEFEHIFNQGFNENHFVEMTTDGGLSWDKVGKFGEGINWYTNSANDVWGNNGQNAGWEKARITLEDAAGEASVKIRISMITDGFVSSFGQDEGAGIDDVTIVVPPNDIFMDSVSTCNNPNFTLDATMYGDSGSYSWSTGDTTAAITVSSAGTYTVTITDPKIGLSFTESVEVIVQAPPVVDFDATQNPNDPDTIDYKQGNGPTVIIDLDPMLPASYTYLWSDGSTFPFFLADPNVLSLGMNNISVTVTDNVGCSTTATHQVFVSNFVGINELEGSNVSLFPNPSNGQLNLQLEGATSLGRMNVYILDYQGRTVYEEVIQDQTGSLKTTFDLSHLAKGMYVFQLQAASGVLNEKLVIK